MASSTSICLITPGHLASTPRLVKAADALSAAGYQVSVIAGRHFLPADPLDAAILAQATWPCVRVSFNTGLPGFYRRLARQFARRRVARGATAPRLLAQAQHAGARALAAAAARVPADLYYGHGGVAGLAAAAAAAHQRGAAYGFDAEDWHEEESSFVQQDPAERAAVHGLLERLLSGARVLTSAAPLIGEAFARRYGVSSTCVLNVFPRAEAPAAPATHAAISPEQPAILYWFSQTIGPERGLEGLLDVLGHLRTPVVLHLRGFVAAGYREGLLARAAAVGARAPVFLPPAPAAEMVRLAAGAHLGLSLEQSLPPNRDLCLTNKIFTYLLAGVPVALTPTQAQRALAPELADAAVLVDLATPAATAARLDDWLARSAPAAAATAWRLGRERFNWEIEQTRLLAALARQFPLAST